MGIDYALACEDCLEFIALHKWSIVEYHSLPSQRLPSLSNQLIVPVTSQQLIKSLDNFVSPQVWIDELLPYVHNFIASHQEHFLFLTCDIGERPWDFGEPRYLEWKGIQTKLNPHSPLLPRNLRQDFGFICWEEVLKYFSQHEAWFLSEQMKDEREALRQAFEQLLEHPKV